MSLKKISCIILLCILIMQVGGLMLVYKLKQCLVQYEMKEALNRKNASFEKLMLSFSDFKKSRINNHEIKWQGRMYDVKTMCVSGSQIELLVIRDTEEQSVLDNINALFAVSGPQKNTPPNGLFRLLTLLYTTPLSVNYEALLKEQNIPFSFFDHQLENFTGDISTPPPEC